MKANCRKAFAKALPGEPAFDLSLIERIQHD
jgi:hypothetical protein